MRYKKILAAAFVLLFALTGLCGCGTGHGEIFTLEDLKNEDFIVGVPDDINSKDFVYEVCPEANIVSQNDVMYGIRSVSEGKADAYVVGRIYIEKTINEGNLKNVRILDEPLHVYECALGISTLSKIPGFEAALNETMETLIADGTIADMKKRWHEDGDYRMPEIALDEDPEYTVKGVTYGQSKPYSFVVDGALTGFDVELAYRVCQANHWGLDLSAAEYPGMLAGLATGKFDMISANLYVTEERADTVTFSIPYETQDISVAVRDFSASAGTGERFIDKVKTGFRKTFVDESRWKMILSGLATTALITLGGFALANLLGAGFCACSMSRKKWLRVIADGYDRIMQGTPMVVVLMIFYYVIFRRSAISGVWVAIFAFGLTGGASLARQFHGAIAGVGKGQTEAALALGFSRTRAFCGIVLPQAIRTLLPGYFSQIIELMKGTAIVGYITVIDLTKAGDQIRSSTYDAFFPLFGVAVIYFLISFGLLSLLQYLCGRLAPKRVTEQEAKK